MIHRSAAAGINAFAADANDLSVGEAPFLTGSAITSDDDDLGAIDRGASLNIKTTSADTYHLAVAYRPLLVGTSVTVKQAHWSAIRRILVRYVNAFAAGRAHQLRCMAADAP